MEANYIYCALYFYDYYIVIYSEILIPLTIVQNQSSRHWVLIRSSQPGFCACTVHSRVHRSMRI